MLEGHAPRRLEARPRERPRPFGTWHRNVSPILACMAVPLKAWRRAGENDHERYKGDTSVGRGEAFAILGARGSSKKQLSVLQLCATLAMRAGVSLS